MRTYAIFAAVGLVAGSAMWQSADAGYHRWTLCWTDWGGGSNCVALPRRYQIPGVRRPRLGNGTVDFFLTPNRIRALSRYVNTRDMLPGQRATVFAPKR